MTKRRRTLATVVALAIVGAAGIATGAESASGLGRSCADAVSAKMPSSNPDLVCTTVQWAGGAAGLSNFEDVFDLALQDLGDGSESLVVSRRQGKDTYAYRPNFHFAKEGDRLFLLLDGKGVPATYATTRPKVNRRYQIERVIQADTGLYEKKEVETWFWTGKEYARAFSQVTLRSEKDSKLNRTAMEWNDALKDAYQTAGTSWEYRVQPGDTLSAIASRQGVPAAEIARQNALADARTLRPGQSLRYESWRVNAR